MRDPKRGIERSFLHLMGPIFGTETGTTMPQTIRIDKGDPRLCFVIP